MLVWPLMSEPRDAYKVLQVDPEADADIIQAAYRRLAQKYHPDRIALDPDPGGPARMVEINAAWAILREPGSRAEYDRARAEAIAARERSRVEGVAGPVRSEDVTGRDSPPGAETSPPSRPVATRDTGPAGPPPGRPSGSVLTFGRYAGWSLGEVGRSDPAYLEWLDRMPIGRIYRAEPRRPASTPRPSAEHGRRGRRQAGAVSAPLTGGTV